MTRKIKIMLFKDKMSGLWTVMTAQSTIKVKDFRIGIMCLEHYLEHSLG